MTHGTSSFDDLRPIENFPRYMVGRNGDVWSNQEGVNGHSPGWKKMKPLVNFSGHTRVDLGRKNSRFIHRLVLETFVGPCPPEMECRHLDGNPANNHVGNLVWGTSKENADDRKRHNILTPENLRRHAKLSEEQVLAIYSLRETKGIRPSLARQFSVTVANIQFIQQGRSWNSVTGAKPYGNKLEKRATARSGRPRGRPKNAAKLTPSTEKSPEEIL